MSALTQSRAAKPRTVKYDLRGVAANAKGYKNGFAMMITGGANAGYFEPANTTDTGIVVAKFAEDFDNTGGANGALSANIEFPDERQLEGFDNDTVNPVTNAMCEQLCYALDDHTVSAAENTKPAGVVYSVSTDGKTVWVEIRKGAPPQMPDAIDLVFHARAVVTSIAAYAAAGGVLTASANGALGSQDGVAVAAGDVVLLPTDKAGTAKDSGPYVVTSVGGASAKFTLQRPSWYATGGTQPSGLMITVGGEGTKYGGSEWKSLLSSAATYVVDTTDGAFYPRLQTVTTAAMIAGVSAANTTLFVGPNAEVMPIPVTPGGTQGTLRVSTQTAGIPAASSLVATSSSNTDTSTVKFNVVNF